MHQFMYLFPRIQATSPIGTMELFKIDTETKLEIVDAGKGWLNPLHVQRHEQQIGQN